MSKLILLPAVDVSNGVAVRLTQGRVDTDTEYGDPLEAALSLLVETDLTLRSAQSAPQMALMERALIRLAMMPSRGRR